MQYVKPYKTTFIVTIMLTLTLAILSPVRPYLAQIAIDKYLPHSDKFSLVMAVVLMLITALISSALQFLYTNNTNFLGQQVIEDIRKKLFHRLLHYRISFFDKTPIGVTVTRLVSDMETIADIFTDGLLLIISDLLQLVAIIAFMFYVDWRLTLISLSTLPLLLIATRIFQKNIKRTFNDVRNAVAQLNTFVQEHLSGIRIVQTFNREEQEYLKFKEINAHHRKANIQSIWYYSIFFPVVELLSAAAIGLLLWYSIFQMLDTKPAFGVIVSFIMYINLLFRPIRELADKFNTLQMGMLSSERIMKLISANEQTNNNGEVDATNIRGKIEFRNVYFTYNYDESKNDDAQNWVLNNVSLVIQPGEMAALVGTTGSGKTTIISLLNRFYEIQKGEILIDDVPIHHFELHSLRARIGLVQQDVFLFSDSIFNNITFFDKNISKPIVEHACAQVGLNTLIQQLPGGLDFNVQERGTQLSAGQRQLLAFARTLVANPTIFILDEATSSIDNESEKLITTATQSLMVNRTSVVIAHRLTTIHHATCIYLLSKGEIKEQGTHLELISKSGLYKKLYELQFEKNSERLS